MQLAIDNAAGIMSWALIKKQQGYTDPVTMTPELVAEYNENFPLDPLTAKRLNKECPTPSAPKPELW